MNIATYISSGILEEFVLGTLSEMEAIEVRKFAIEHEEIRNEIDRIEQSLEIYIEDYSSSAPTELKATILSTIEETKGFNLKPPVLSPNSKIAEYNYWLNTITAPHFEDMHMEVIAESKEETMAIAWAKKGEEDHTHNEYTERFLIVEGTCTAFIGGIQKDYGRGDYIEFPKDVQHSYIVTSPDPMKVVACLQY